MPEPLTKLYVEATTVCNLDCIMCVQRCWNESHGTMQLESFAALMDQIREFDKPPTIHISGFGEPLMHPHILDMVQLAKDTGAAVEMTTNAMLLNRDKVEALMEIGLDRIVVSVDGATAESFEEIRARASFERVIDNLMELKRQRIRHRGRHGDPQLALAFVAMKNNVADLPMLPTLAFKVGAWEILVSNLIPHTPELEQQILYGKALNACTYRKSIWSPELSLPKLDISSDTIVPLVGAFNSRSNISLLDASLSGRNDFCRFAQWGYSVVRWDGEVSPCLSLLHDHPEYIHGRRKEITRHRFGNVNERGLGEIWRSVEYTAYRRRLREYHFSPCSTCGGCERFPFNMEDCSDNVFPTCGHCLWAQGFVQCA